MQEEPVHQSDWEVALSMVFGSELPSCSWSQIFSQKDVPGLDWCHEAAGPEQIWTEGPRMDWGNEMLQGRSEKTVTLVWELRKELCRPAEPPFSASVKSYLPRIQAH